MDARVVDAGGQPVHVLRPDGARAGVVLVGERGAPDADALAAAAGLAGEGYAVAVVDLWWRRAEGVVEDDPPGTAAAALSDPEGLRDVAAARAVVADAGRTFIVGIGAGGTLARLAACAMLGFAGAVSFAGRVVYPTLTAAKPLQPLDLLPGLACPLQCHFGDADPLTPPAHIRQLEARLRDRGVPSQVFVYPGAAAGFVSPSSPAYQAAAAALAWARTRTLLDMLTEA